MEIIAINMLPVTQNLWDQHAIITTMITEATYTTVIIANAKTSTLEMVEFADRKVSSIS